MTSTELVTLNDNSVTNGSTDASGLEWEVMRWFAADHEVLWIPIYVIGSGPCGLAEADAEREHFGGPRVIHNLTEFYQLPLGITGWLFPAHLDDTEVVCARTGMQEMSFGSLAHPRTGQSLTYRSSADLRAPEPSPT